MRKIKSSTNHSDSHVFTKEQVVKRLDSIIDRTLGEIDESGVFERALDKPKITGIAGDVIEQSVLGYDANSDKTPDILLDGVETEVKVTGIRRSNKAGSTEYEAKEPMSITAVSVNIIVGEEFNLSAFKHKVDQMLIVYYLYDSDKTVKAYEYARFPVKGYEIHRFNEQDMKILEADWTTVRDFIRFLQSNYDEPEKQYPRLSHELRDRLMYIDTAPKWPNPPRFRLKRAVVSEMVREHFSKNRYRSRGAMSLEDFDSYSELDDICDEIAKRYHGRTVDELIDEFGIEVGDRDKLSKSIAEMIVVRMFGGDVKKMRDIEIVRKIGLNLKTVSVSVKGERTEDMKLMPVDFEEFLDPDLEFEDSLIFDYFANHQLLCVVFQEKDKNQKFRENRFLGFRRLAFQKDFIEKKVRSTWDDVRHTVYSGNLRDEVVTTKSGKPRHNPKGNIMTAPNLPKSENHDVFLRGTGADSDDKPVELCGVRMYRQDVWLKGSVIVDLLKLGESDLIPGR